MMQIKENAGIEAESLQFDGQTRRFGDTEIDQPHALSTPKSPRNASKIDRIIRSINPPIISTNRCPLRVQTDFEWRRPDRRPRAQPPPPKPQVSRSAEIPPVDRSGDESRRRRNGGVREARFFRAKWTRRGKRFRPSRHLGRRGWKMKRLVWRGRVWRALQRGGGMPERASHAQRYDCGLGH